MRILISTKDFFPARGGLQSSVDKIIHRFKACGHVCAVITQLPFRDKRQPRVLKGRVAKKLFNRPVIVQDKTPAYDIFRVLSPRESLPVIKESFKPDVMMCAVGGYSTMQFSMQLLESAAGLPALIYSCDMQGITLTADPVFAKTRVVANAELIADLIGVFRNRPMVIPCIVDSHDCRIDSSREMVLYINPNPRKGEILAWEIAGAATGLKFVFQESWRIGEKKRQQIFNRAEKLGNVEFRTVTDTPAEIYRDARVLLAPYGPERPRVIDEAQANGIPVVACDVPGLDESVGPGGVLIDPVSDIHAWVSVLRRLYSDTEYYESLVASALQHNGRPEMKSDYLADLFERELKLAIAPPNV